MNFKSVVLASMTTLALVACGTDNDKAKPDDGKSNLPEKTKECIAAGDNCVLDGDKWVIKDGKDDKKPSNDEAPVADTNFDYSDIGVTDTLEPEKRGFGFWHKGVESPLNAKKFAKNKPTLSPIIQWSSKLNYDEDLYNFVAVTLDNGQKDTKNAVKFMFDKIGVTNQEKNQNKNFFGSDKFTVTTKDSPYQIGSSSFDGTTYGWNIVPALVNTFMYKNNKDSWTVSYADPEKKAFLNQEEEAKSEQGSGAQPLRVYGVNAFLDTDATKLMKADRKNPAATDELDTLSTRTGNKYLQHANIAWYKLSTKGKRVAKAHVNDDGNEVVQAIDYYKDAAGKNITGIFPTDNELDTLKHTQFGRLTGEGINPEADKIDGYTDDNLKLYEYTQGKAAIGGNKAGEDWYFARGTEPAPQGTLDNLKAAGKEVVYDGQAVMFGIDYDPRKPVTSKEANGDQSTNAVKPIEKVSKAHTLLDGKQNFVRLVWDPASGDVKGSVYGVWTNVTYLRANADDDAVKKGNAYKFKIDATTKKLTHDNTNQVVLDQLVGDKATDNNSIFVAQSLLVDAALRIEPWINPLVKLNGKVVEGTNSFGGTAVRVKDDSKGLFSGAFFGKDASEVGGVIDSQTGNFKDENLADPGSKWGGAFGAKSHASETPEDLVFQDSTIDYGTSTEFFNTG